MCKSRGFFWICRMSEIGCCFRVFCAHVSLVFLATSCCRCFESESVHLYLDCFFIFFLFCNFGLLFGIFVLHFLLCFGTGFLGKLVLGHVRILVGHQLIHSSQEHLWFWFLPISPFFVGFFVFLIFYKVVLIFLGASFCIWIPMMMWCASIFTLWICLDENWRRSVCCLCILCSSSEKFYFFETATVLPQRD